MTGTHVACPSPLPAEPPLRGSRHTTTALLLAATTALASCASHTGVRPAPPPSSTTQAPHGIVPLPVSASVTPGQAFTVQAATPVVVPAGDVELLRLGRQLAVLLGRPLEKTLEVREAAGAPSDGAISLAAGANDPTLGDEGYSLTVTPSGIAIRANRPAGVFYGLQSLRLLLPASIEYEGARPRPLSVPAAHVVDHPRYAWRGAMLDVSRHFFDVPDVKRYIDLLALYKFNRLHLHLSDDQGWRIEIVSWPNLTAHGGKTQVGGGRGGFYTQKAYAEIVAYARDRFMTIVPEIDMPGHTNAALSSYPELNCDGVAPPPYTGIEVGFSTLCVDKDVTYRFIDDVVREIGAMTPGPYFHLGGDEVKKLTPQQYNAFVERVQGIVKSHGKEAVGWDEVAAASLLPTTIVQQWRPKEKFKVPAGSRVILSPANLAYIDMKYDKTTALGLDWAGLIDVRTAYSWDPATVHPGLSASAIIGVEAPMWSETLVHFRDVEFLAFPRIAAIAEVAWTPADARRWDEFRLRLAAQAPRWSALGVNAYWTPEVPWTR